MSGTIWPVDAVSGAPNYTGRMLREAALTSLAGGATAARPFGGFSGVRPGTSTAIGTMSGLNYTITPFGGLIDGEASTLAGVYGFAFPANETGTINAQTGTARTDLLSVVLNDPAEGDAGLPSVKIVYTAGPSPVSPGHGFDLYTVNVPATGGGSPTLTWIGKSTVAAGGILTCASSATYPTAANFPGFYIDDLSTGQLLRSNGTAWLVTAGNVVGTLGIAAGYTQQSGYTNKLEKNGNIVTLFFALNSTSGTATGTINTGPQIGTLPTGFRPTNPLIGFAGFNNSGNVTINYTIDSSGVLRAYPIGTTLGTGAVLYGAISFSVA